MEVNIEPAEDYEVIGTGSFITFRDKPIQIRIKEHDPKAQDMFIKLTFFEDLSKDKPDLKVSVNKDTISFELINYNNVLGTGTTFPVHIGSSEKKDIYFHFRVYGMTQKGDKLVHYTLYLADQTTDEIKVG